MTTNPIAPVTRRSPQVEKIQQLTGIVRAPSDTNGGSKGASSTKTSKPIVHRDPSSTLTKRRTYEGVAIFILTGDYAGQRLFLGTDVVSVSMSQSANWSDKEGQRMRTGINFVNISPRTLSFTADFYNPGGDISPVVENIAHIQEITASAAGAPPFLLIKMGDTVYENAVSTSFAPEFSEPLPTFIGPNETRSGGYRRAKVRLEFKIAGGQGSAYRSAQPFNSNTQMRSFYETKTAAEVKRQGVEAAGTLLLSRCLSKSENEEFDALISDDAVGDPNAYLTMSSELFIQLATAGLPDSVLQHQGFIERLKKELAKRIAIADPPGKHTPEQLASALFQGVPLDIYEGDFPALLASYNASLNAILESNLSSLDQKSDSLLTSVSRCGRAIADSKALEAIASASNADPTFTAANLSYLSGNSKISDSSFRKMLGLGSRIDDSIVSEIRERKVYESKADFIEFVSARTDGLTAHAAIATVEQSENETMKAINEFLQEQDLDAIKSRFKFNDEQAMATIGKTFANKAEFLRAVYGINPPRGKTFTASSGLSAAGKYWDNFQSQQT